nr:hypothetical protein C1N82_10530 [Bacillus cereus]
MSRFQGSLHLNAFLIKNTLSFEEQTFQQILFLSQNYFIFIFGKSIFLTHNILLKKTKFVTKKKASASTGAHKKKELI